MFSFIYKAEKQGKDRALLCGLTAPKPTVAGSRKGWDCVLHVGDSQGQDSSPRAPRWDAGRTTGILTSRTNARLRKCFLVGVS